MKRPDSGRPFFWFFPDWRDNRIDMTWITDRIAGGKKGFLQHRQPAADQMDRIYRIFQDQQDFRIT